MKRNRLAAASAGIVTALLLQATVVGPALAPFAVSLPAVLVGAVALVDGPATGLSFGFVAGLVADLGSRHPAGILALCWLAVGLACGAVADRNGVVRDSVTAGVVAGMFGVVAGGLLVLVHEGGTLRQVAGGAVPTLLGDVVLAVPLVLLTRRMLRSQTLRAPHPVLIEIPVGTPRA